MMVPCMQIVMLPVGFAMFISYGDKDHTTYQLQDEGMEREAAHALWTTIVHR